MNNSFKWFLALASMASLAFLTPPVTAQEKGGSDSKSAKKAGGMASNDAQALQKLAQSDMAEIAAGKVAAQKGSSAEVKKYGQHMVDEHSKMLEEGKALAQKKGVTPPNAPDKMHQAALEKLQGLSGDDFDRQFLRQMVKDHEDALKLAEKTAKDAKDADLKAHAEKGAPHIKQHLADARKLTESLGASAGSSSKATQGK